MKKASILIVIFLVLSSFTGAHKFYVSVTEIEHSEKERSLQIISRVFFDDFEDILKLRYDPEIRLGKNVESPGVKAYIEKYLQQKLSIKIDGKPATINYIGKQYDNDMIILYIEVPNVEEFKTIKVKNTILMDLFEEQKNLIHVEKKGKTKSLVLTSGEMESIINF